MENLIEKLNTKTSHVGLMTLKNGVNKFVCIKDIDEDNNKCIFIPVTKKLAEDYLKTGDTLLYETMLVEETALSDIIYYYPYNEITKFIKEFKGIKKATRKRMGHFIKALGENSNLTNK